MKCWTTRLLVCLLLSHTLAVRPVGAVDGQAAGSETSNAAVIYWQAFAAFPMLQEDQQVAYEAAIQSVTEPVGDELMPIMAEFDHALRELHRARGVTSCDWNLNYADGLGLRLPHLAEARALAGGALLRARLRFAAAATDEAVLDVVAVLKLGCDCGSSPLMISRLVNFAIENLATEVLAVNLVSLSPQQLDNLAIALKTLPATPSVADCKRFEVPLFGELAASEEIQATFAKATDREAAFRVRRELLQLAVQVQRHGVAVLQDASIPICGPVEFQQTAAGFELRCLPKTADEPVVLRVGTDR